MNQILDSIVKIKPAMIFRDLFNRKISVENHFHAPVTFINKPDRNLLPRNGKERKVRTS